MSKSYSKLAQLYARGDCVPKNQKKAMTLARQGDRAGDVEAIFFLHMLLTNGPLSQTDASGKPDEQKYQQRASRKVAERALDVEAKDTLYRAAAQGYLPAQQMLALTLGGTIGEGNQERMLALITAIPGPKLPVLNHYEQVSRYMKALGQTHTSAQLFFDSRQPVAMAGLIATCGLPATAEAKTAAPLRLTAIAVSRPLRGAVYLPSKVPGNERAFLLAGDWDEAWTYSGCGRQAQVMVTFTADGMGGAYMRSAPLSGAATAADAGQ